MDADVLGQMRDGDNLHGAVHAASLDVVNAGVDVLAGAVELGGVNMNDQGLALQAGNGQCRGESHPVMRVDNVKVIVAGNLGGQARITLNLGKHVAGIR